mgnify:FL=1
MKSTNFELTRYDADEGMVFDWVVDRFIDEVDENGNPTGNKIQEHLYAKTLFIGGNDSIYNYVEVYKPEE